MTVRAMTDSGRAERPLRPWTALTRESQAMALHKALKDARGNVSAAARVLGIARSHAMRLLKQYELADFARRLRVEAGTSKTGFGAPRPKT